MGGQMKEVTAQQLDGTVGIILADKEKLSRLKGESFKGVSNSDVINELNARLGDDWFLVKNRFKFTEDDVNAAGNNRYFKAKGMTILIAWALAILALVMFTTTIPVIPVWAYYIANAFSAIGFLYIFLKGQRQSRRELWRSIYGDNIEFKK